MMNVLAIDTSQKTVSVAIFEDDTLRADLFINSGLHHSEVLLPAIDQACCMAGMKVGCIDLFALTIGPGAFTGLRIGATTIKGLALSTGKPVVGVSTLEALAFNLVHTGQKVCPLLDAQKNQVYTALYQPAADGGIQSICAEQVVRIDQWIDGLSDPVLFLGDGAVAYGRQIQERFSTSTVISEACLNHVRATAVATLARKRYYRGEWLDLLTFAPRYLRPPEAEISVRQEASQIDKAG